MIHLSDPAAYHDKRFKNNPAKRKTMKTKMPEPVAARVWIGRMEDLVLDYLYSEQGDGEPLFTEAQLKAAMVAAWNEAIEACVNAYSPDDTADDYTDKMMAMKETP